MVFSTPMYDCLSTRGLLLDWNPNVWSDQESNPGLSTALASQPATVSSANNQDGIFVTNLKKLRMIENKVKNLPQLVSCIDEIALWMLYKLRQAANRAANRAVKIGL